MGKTFNDAQEDLHEAGLEFLYQFNKSIGIIWLAKKLPFLELRDWVKRKEEETE